MDIGLLRTISSWIKLSLENMHTSKVCVVIKLIRRDAITKIRCFATWTFLDRSQKFC